MATTTPIAPRKFLTRHEAADLLRISDRTLYSLTKSGQVPYIRLGQRCVRYPVEELERWLKQNTLGGDQQGTPRSGQPTIPI